MIPIDFFAGFNPSTFAFSPPADPVDAGEGWEHGDSSKAKDGAAGDFSERTHSRVQGCTTKGCYTGCAACLFSFTVWNF